MVSSGKNYLAAYRQSHPTMSDGSGLSTVDKQVKAAAAVEPQLRLPAKFGLARIVNGRMTAVPSSELEIWRDAISTRRAAGEFVVISPLVAALAAPDDKSNGVQNVVRNIRVGAARQHVDAVLIYEIGATTTRKRTPFALADLTIIGGFILPTRSIDALGVAQAVLIDVRNGYPYAMASAEADLSKFATTWGAGDKRSRLEDEAAYSVVQKLVPKVEKLFDQLVLELTVQNSQSNRPPVPE